MTKQTKQFAVLTRETAWMRVIESFEVEVMVTKGIYAMVRRKGAAPFVALVKDLTPIEADK